MYVASGADGDSVDEQSHGVRQIPLSFSRVGRARRKISRDARRDGENCQNHQDCDKLRGSHSRQPDAFIRLPSRLQPLIQRRPLTADQTSISSANLPLYDYRRRIMLITLERPRDGGLL